MRQFSPNGTSRPGHVKDVLARLLKRGGATITALSLLTVGALIAGCGGGGSSGDAASVPPATVTGVAATGTALVGTVTLRDSSARPDKVKTINSDGSFEIDVSDRTAPFVLKATGTADGVNHTMFSFAATAGTANVNPLSSVAVANAAGVDDPAEVFDRHDSAGLEKVRTAMPASVTTLQSKLKPLLVVFDAGDVDPVKTQFTANHEGLDGVFDNVKVVISGGTLTITNVTTGAVLFTAQVKDIEHGNFFNDDDVVPKRGAKPAAPTGVTAVGGAGQVTVSWVAVANATSYDLIYSKATRSKHAEEDDGDDEDATRVRNVTSPFIVTGLAASTTYFVTVRARNNGRRGPPSAQVSATTTATIPAATIPAAPTGITATGGNKQVTISWAAVSGATSFNVYWSPTTGVTTTTGQKISVTNPPAVHTGLADSATFFYVVTAVNTAGESAASVQTSATTLAFVPTTTTTTAATTTTTAVSTSTTATAPTSTTSTTATTSTTSTTAPTSTTTTTARPTTTTTAPTTSTTTTTSTPTTTTTTASTTTTTLAALNGVAIYNTNCSGCHGANGKRGSTASQITNAIANNTGGMGFINLTQAQIAAIAARP